MEFSEKADNLRPYSIARRVCCFACACILRGFLPDVHLQRPSREAHTAIWSVLGGRLVHVFLVELDDGVAQTTQRSQLLLTGGYAHRELADASPGQKVLRRYFDNNPAYSFVLQVSVGKSYMNTP